jgi:putative DNA primase/helicase
MSEPPFAPIASAARGSSSKAPAEAPKEAWTIVVPVPATAPPPPDSLSKLGKPSAIYPYHDAAGGMLGCVWRYDRSGEKEFYPVTLWRSGTALKWRFKSWPAPRPLFGLRALAERPAAPVLVVEGEKAALAAARLLPDYVVVTSPNGSKAARKANWSPLKSRDVCCWPDADDAGMRYMREVGACIAEESGKFIAATKGRARGAAIKVVIPPPETAQGWDAADAEKEGMTAEQASALVDNAVPFEDLPRPEDGSDGDDEEDAADAKGGDGRRRPLQRDILVGLTDLVELWHDDARVAYATFQVKDHRENWPIRSRDFRMWLSSLFFEKTGNAIGGQALEDTIRILEARAVNEGPQHQTFTRVGHANGCMYLDLGDPTWRAVENGPSGTQVVTNPPLKFLRSPSMRSLPVPEHGYELNELRRFVNVKTDDDFVLVVAWIIAALRHRGPFPILAINGEAGAGKSLFTRIVRSLVDPSAAPIRAVPRDDRDLVVSASNSWVLAFDNLSNVPVWLADALCRLATGSGFATRALHTDRDEMIFDAARPIMINGIPHLTDRADLADRSITIHLRAIPEDERRPEDELLAEFEAVRHHILGTLMDAVSRAIRNLPDVKLERAPRMADFVKLMTAAESGLGWEPGTFWNAYGANRHDVVEATFEADPSAVGIWRLIMTNEKYKERFEGTAAELLEAINSQVAEPVKHNKYWPQNAAQLGNRVLRAAPLLRAKGCTIERRHSGVRTIMIVPPLEVTL